MVKGHGSLHFHDVITLAHHPHMLTGPTACSTGVAYGLMTYCSDECAPTLHNDKKMYFILECCKPSATFLTVQLSFVFLL